MPRELDEKITQLSSPHLLTEEALGDLKATIDAFIASLPSGDNGKATTVISRSRYSTAANSRHCLPCDSATPLCVTYPL